MNARYTRQEAYKEIGKSGQEKISESRIAIIGLGAIGSVAAVHLARAGVKFIRLIDRDFVEPYNLQRQLFYTEEDASAGAPKADALAKHLQSFNSEISYESVVADANTSTIDSMISDVDLVLDGSDSYETRFLINEACLENKKSWIYGGSKGSVGMTKNFLYGKEEACFRCIMDFDRMTKSPCVAEGYFSPASTIIGSIEAAEAMKILLGSDKVRKGMLYYDAWTGMTREVAVMKNPDCPVCVHGKYNLYGNKQGLHATVMCGKKSVHIVPAKEVSLNFAELADKLKNSGSVEVNAFTLNLTVGDVVLQVFKNGRAVVKNTMDMNHAKSIYTKYVGN